MGGARRARRDVRTMTHRIGIAQCARLLVCPECLMTPFEKTREDFIASAEPLYGRFSEKMARIAERFGLWIIYTMNERGEAGEDAQHANPLPLKRTLAQKASTCDIAAKYAGPLPYNTAVIADDAGAIRGFYRKTHLYDAFSVRESERMAPGDRLFDPLETPFGRIGLGICYDLRFPEVGRDAACKGCDLFVLPAAWVDGPGKADQWKTLLRARAVENEMFVAGACRCDERYIGKSLVADPFGRIACEAKGREETLLVADIDLSIATEARCNMPVFEHRKPHLYGSLGS